MLNNARTSTSLNERVKNKHVAESSFSRIVLHYFSGVLIIPLFRLFCLLCRLYTKQQGIRSYQLARYWFVF